MERQRAEIASAKTPPIGGEAEFYLPDGGNPAEPAVHRVIIAHIWQRIDIVHLHLRQRHRRRILDDKGFAVIGLEHPVRGERVRVLILNPHAVRERALVLTDRLKIRQSHGALCPRGLVGQRGEISCFVNRPADEGDVLHPEAARERVRDLYNTVLTHPVGDEIGAGLQQNRAAHTVRPIVIMPHPSETRLDAADHNRRPLVFSPDQIAVHNHRPVRPVPCLAVRTVRVLVPVLSRDRVMIHHRIHISGRHQEPEPRLPEYINALRGPPVRLTDHPHMIPMRRQNPGYDRRAEARVINIRIPADIDKVHLRKSHILHFLPRHG